MKTLSGISVLMIASVLCACTGSVSSVAPTSSSSWKSEHFTVRLIAGETIDGTSKSSSRYEITPTRSGAKSHTASSAHTIGGFSAVSNPAPSNYTTVFADSLSEALLIQEVIPNDCAPCSNYIWVRPQSDTTFTHSYLQLPSRGLGGENGIDYEMPKALSLRGGILTYKYSTGKKIAVSVSQVPSSQEPTPPG